MWGLALLFNIYNYQKTLLLYIICSLLSVFNCYASDYKLGPGDTIHVDVYDEQDLQVKLRIDKSGILTFPFLGDIYVIGLTTKEISRIIEDGLKGDYLIEPHVNVSVTNYRPFYINGLVNRPGGYPYQEGLTLDKAIALAGGLASRASKSDWTVTREVDGKTVKFEAVISTDVNPDDIINIGQSFF